MTVASETAPVTRRLRLAALLVSRLLVFAACGGGGGGGDGGDSASSTTTSAAGAGEVIATAANYELLANRDQRFIAGLVVRGDGRVVSFGTVKFGFFYLGTREKPIDPPEAKFDASGTFAPIGSADATADAGGGEPRKVRPSEGLGVYRASNVRFDTAGYWGVEITATIDGKRAAAETVFEVFDQPRVPAPGQPAPRTAMPVAGAPGVKDTAIDSRATGGDAIPDPELHATTVADALAAGKPTVVVVSTPVFCVSKFCGPITDAVSDVAKRYGDRVAFVHLEVWGDFEKKQLNPWAGEWIRLPSGDANEPWVFTIGRDGVIVDRFDNVVGNDELETAVARIAA